MTARFESVAALLAAATRSGAVPAAAIEVGSAEGPVWAAGAAAGVPSPAHCDAIWDLASLTKVIATTSLVARLVSRGRLSLDTQLQPLVPDWPAARTHDLRVRDLLAHCAGLAAYAPLHLHGGGREAFRRAIVRAPLGYVPRTRSVYSDLGFILLGHLLEAIAGTSLDAQCTEADLADADWLGFGVPERWHPRVAPTRGTTWHRTVHDENAAGLGGVAGHAGLFGTVAAVGRFAQRTLRGWMEGDPALGPAGLLRAFTRRSAVHGSSRALGWDTMLRTSSCGSRMSPRAVGHTGFTGTSLWIDPRQDLYVVLLTNRVAGTATDAETAALRRTVHDAVAHAWSGTSYR
jgi:CubicO group peptidase (beta-lactamase class C family)